MRLLTGTVVAAAALVLAMAMASAGEKEDSIARGKKLFEDRRSFGGVRACSSCHPGGQGLERAKNKKSFRVMGNRAESLEEAINLCIEGANKGGRLALDSQEMKDLVNYIKSL